MLKPGQVVSGEKNTGINDSSKIYLKSDYKVHLGMSDRCADHCVAHALSDSRNVEYCEQCQHGDEHDLIYERLKNYDSQCQNKLR